mmetsp:Transcript_19160/g.21907  ORF Transcript_19160/g.21907 Transcript_19160/m.21907 type:complete len:375 (+) Transcript_19160:157-1281(+)
MLPCERIRYKLAQIFMYITAKGDEEPCWNQIYENIEDAAVTLKERNVEVKPIIFDLASMMCDAQDLLRLPRNSKVEINEYRKLLKEKHEEDGCTFLALNSLVDAYEEGTESDILSLKPFPKAFLHRKFTNWLKSIVKHHLDVIPIPCALERTRRSKCSSDSRNIYKLQNCLRSRAIKAVIENDKNYLKCVDDCSEDKKDYHQVKDELRKARNDLTRKVEDPFEESRKLAKNAKDNGVGGGRFFEVKHSARRLEFDQEDLEINDPEEWQPIHVTHQLSDLPSTRRQTFNDNSIQTNESKKKKRRIFWSQEQKTAFKAAIADYGIGNWIGIRDAIEYKKYWKGKSNVHLKDLYRNMLKNEEISPTFSIKRGGKGAE